MISHLIIPDTQCKDEQDFEYLTRIGQYIIEVQPEVVIHLGDFADMPSLSSYDVGKKSFEGRRYTKDIEAAKKAMHCLLDPLYSYNTNAKLQKKKQYHPRKVMLLGNHENRIARAINDDPKLEGLISYKDLPYDDWEVHDFLKPVFIDGIAYSHYFPTGVMGRAATTASAMVSKLHMSCIAGHQQGKQVAYGKRPDGSTITCIIAGSCYEHDEDYLGPQGNNHFRGILMAYDVQNGSFDEHFVSLKYLKEHYAKPDTLR